MTHAGDAAGASPPARVSTVELFFDLVFVFAITQLTHLVEHAHGGLDLLRVFLVLTVVWWMYDAYAWLTTAAGARGGMRLVLLGAMAGFLVMALAVPRVFERDGLTFGLAYLFVVLLHHCAFAWSGGQPSRRALLGIAPTNLGAAALLIAAAFAGGPRRWIFFLGASLLFVALTVHRREREFTINPSHFVERHGLILLIALGESVVAIGGGASERPLDAHTLATILIALALIAALWWSYFDRDDERAESILVAASPEQRSRYALIGYWYAHLVMIFGVVLLAAGIHGVVAGHEVTSPRIAWLLAGGLAVYLLGDVAFRATLGLRPLAPRALGAAVAASMGWLGMARGGLVELAALCLVAVATLAGERFADRRAIA